MFDYVSEANLGHMMLSFFKVYMMSIRDKQILNKSRNLTEKVPAAAKSIALIK